jgi:hypothetical protein
VPEKKVGFFLDAGSTMQKRNGPNTRETTRLFYYAFFIDGCSATSSLTKLKISASTRCAAAAADVAALRTSRPALEGTADATAVDPTIVAPELPAFVG